MLWLLCFLDAYSHWNYVYKYRSESFVIEEHMWCWGLHDAMTLWLEEFEPLWEWAKVINGLRDYLWSLKLEITVVELDCNCTSLCCLRWLNGIIHAKMKILSLFTHPCFVSSLYDFLSFMGHKRRHFEFGSQPYSKCLLLCSSEERKSYRLVMT